MQNWFENEKTREFLRRAYEEVLIPALMEGGITTDVLELANCEFQPTETSTVRELLHFGTNEQDLRLSVCGRQDGLVPGACELVCELWEMRHDGIERASTFCVRHRSRDGGWALDARDLRGLSDEYPLRKLALRGIGMKPDQLVVEADKARAFDAIRKMARLHAHNQI